MLEFFFSFDTINKKLFNFNEVRLMTNRIKYIVSSVAVIILIIACVVYFSFNSKADSPDYAIKIIEESLTNHDKKTFDSVVDVDQLLNSSYDNFVDGMIDFDRTMPNEVKDSISNFAQIMKSPMISSLKVAIENYVETGTFENQSNEPNQNLIAASEILSQSGLNKIQFRQVENVTVDDENDNRAIVKIRVWQQDISREFVFDVELVKNDLNEWKVVGVKNFRNFINMMNQSRREQISKYLEETSEIIIRHDKTIREAEQKYGSILSIGSLGQDDTRDDLKNLMSDVIKKDWEVRKQELFNVSVPNGAEALQNLRIKICDLSIESADLYSKWLTDKKAQTIKDAEEKRKQVQILLDEERLLINRMMK